MATKNIKKLTYNLPALMEDFKSSLGLSDVESAKLESLPSEIAEKEQEIATLEFKINDTRKSLEELDDSRPDNEILASIVQYQKILDDISELSSLNQMINNLRLKESSELTPEDIEQLDGLLKVRTEILSDNEEIFNELVQIFGVNKLNEIYSNLSSHISDLKKIIEKRKELQELQAQLIKSREDLQSQVDLNESLQDRATKSAELSLDNFKDYLKKNKLSTVHAKELFDHYLAPYENPLKLNSAEVEIRKTHPKRDAFIKKFLIPTATTAGAFGLAASAITAAGLVDGSSIMGLIPISQTPGLTVLATGVVAGVIGAVATPLIIIAKDKLTKLHYNVWYKNAKTNLRDYENGTSIDSLHISKLIEKTQKTKRKILEMGQGNWFSRMFNFIPKHILNAVNRNRIHHLEAYAIDLMEIYHNREHHIALNSEELKAEKLRPVYDLLRQVEDFISQDIKESKVHAMLTCKKSGKHTHKSMVEDIDIFSNLETFVEAISQAKTRDEITKRKKIAKTQTKNISHKRSKAIDILNNEERLITRMLNFNQRYAPILPDDGMKFEPLPSHDATNNFEPIYEDVDVYYAQELPPIEDVEFVEIEPASDNNVDDDFDFQPIVKKRNVQPSVTPAPAPVEIEPIDQNSADDTDDLDFPNFTFEIVEDSEEITPIAIEETPVVDPFIDPVPTPAVDPNPVVDPDPTPIDKDNSGNLGKLVRKATQRLQYASSAITHAGKVVGVKLTVNANGNKNSTEIRYMASKNKIRIKTANGEKFVPITDTIIPPMNQMNQILQDVAAEEHIDNADSLTIL